MAIMIPIISNEDFDTLYRYKRRYRFVRILASIALFIAASLALGSLLMKPKSMTPIFETSTDKIIQIPYSLNKDKVRDKDAEEWLWASIRTDNGIFSKLETCVGSTHEANHACFYYSKANDEQKKFMQAQLDLRRNDKDAFNKTVTGLELNKIYENPDYRVNYKVAYAFDMALYGQPTSPWLVKKISDLEVQNANAMQRLGLYDSIKVVLFAMGLMLSLIHFIMRNRLNKLESTINSTPHFSEHLLERNLKNRKESSNENSIDF